MKDTTTALVIGGGLAAWFLLRKPVAHVTTDYGFDLSPYGGQADYPNTIKIFAQAIARAEGFYLRDSIPSRAHNPGDLKLAGRETLAGTSITRFADDNQGWTALYRQLWIILTGQSDYYTPDMSIEDMAAVWTATDPDAWARNVAMFAGVDPKTPVWQVLT